MAIKREVRLTVNGAPRSVEVEPRRTLLDCLRNDLSLTGMKRVCDMGDCGACTVVLEGRAVYACLVLAVDADGEAVTTIEGVAHDHSLSSVQRAFLEADAYQCGFCTPGQVMSLEALLAADPDPNEEAILRALSGNLCRCGAYQNLVAAAHLARERGHA